MTLGGTIFGYNVISQDYSYEAAIKSLKDACDTVVILDAGSTDGSQGELTKFTDHKCKVILLDGVEWADQKGREKLAYFTNRAMAYLPPSRWSIAGKDNPDAVDFWFNLQMDEVLHEDSIPFIRQAMETGAEGFLTRRHNLWRDPYHQLNVVQSRKPCSTEIIRLTKPGHLSVGDAESVECQPYNLDFLDKIEIYHMGYVRDPVVMKAKAIHMQEEVFQMDQHDKRLDLSDKFEWDSYFNETDIIPIRKPLPKYVQKWASDRYPEIKPPVFKVK